MLQKELLEAIPDKSPAVKYIVDLFSGGESWRRQVEAQGYIYIGVDLRRSASETSDQELGASSKGRGGVVVGTSCIHGYAKSLRDKQGR